MTQIWAKRTIFEFSQKIRKRHFFRIERLGLVKKLAKSNERIAKKWENPPFLDILGQNGQFWKFLAKMGKMGIFSKKRLEHFSRAYKP